MRALAILSCFLAAQAAWALDPHRRISQYAHTAWRNQDGAVYFPSAIGQTTEGYLWVGTRSGLMRFDGVRFTRWASPKGQDLPRRGFGALLGTKDGTLWIGTSAGLYRLKDGELTSFMLQPTGAGVGAIVEDAQGAVWITRYRINDGKGPLCRIIAQEVRCFGKAEGLPAPYGLGIAHDPDGTIWMGSSMLYRWSPTSQASTTYFEEVLKHSGGDGAVDVAVGNDGSVWATLDGIGPGLGVRRYAGGTWAAYKIPGFDGAALRSHTLFLDRSGALWVGTESHGLYRIHEGTADHYGPVEGLTGKSVNHIFEDQEGNIWVATNGGLDMFRETPVVTFSSNEGLSASTVRSLLALRNGSVWIGNDEAIDVIDGQRLSSITMGNGLPGQDLGAMLEDRSGRIWIGVGHRIFTYQGGRFVETRKPDGSPLGNLGYPTALSEDPASGDVWAAVFVSPERRLLRFKDQVLVETVALKEPMQRARILASNGEPGVWLSAGTDTLGRYRNGKMEVVPLPKAGGALVTNDLTGDPDGTVWASTSSGLYRWKDGRISVLDGRNGLPCASILASIRDDDGRLWLNAECGLIRISAQDVARWTQSPESKVAVKRFDTLDGALVSAGAVPNQPRAARSTDGRLWFGSTESVEVIDPRRREPVPAAPPVHIEELIADRKSYPASGPLTLPPLRRELEIAYTAPLLGESGRVTFRHKLEGRDTDWYEAGTRREAFFHDLPPGEYLFHVSARHGDGAWNEAGAALGFSIAPMWYQTSWFRLLAVLSVVGLVWLVYDLRVRQIKRSQEAVQHAQAALAEMSKLATLGETAAAIAHEVNQPLSAISANASACQRFLRAGPPNLDEAQNAAGRIVRDVGRATDVIQRVRQLFGRAEVTKAPLDINETIDEAVALTRARVLLHGAILRTELAAGIPPVLGDRIQLQQVVVNLVANAAEAMKEVEDRPRGILVRTFRDSTHVRVEVRDSGSGIPSEQKDQIFQPFHTTKQSGMGMGLAICKTIVESHGGKLGVTINEGPGATFHFTIPLST